MKKIWFTLALVASTVMAAGSELIDIKLFDRETVRGKLDVPDGVREVSALVIFVPGTGPATYLNRRKAGTFDFNYFDLFAAEFSKRGAGFFAFNRRGVTLGTEPPTYEVIDRTKYVKAVPSVEVKDIRTIVKHFRKDRRFKKAKIALLGWSEGTVLASMAAEDPKAGIDALFLAGYVNESMYDIIRWQNQGGSSMVALGPLFDRDKDGRIAKSEFEGTEEGVRKGIFKTATFEQLDGTKDGFLAAEDFAILNAGRYQAILDAAKKGDDDWIWRNYFHITTAWLREHFALEANKTRLLRLNLPITIFHGIQDANCPIEGVRDIQRRFEIQGKSNLAVQVFEGHNHDLNYQDFIMKKAISPGLAAIFDAAAKLAVSAS